MKVFWFLLQISTVAESEDSQESVDSVTDSQKRREILSRRPSYRSVWHLITNILITILDILLFCLVMQRSFTLYRCWWVMQLEHMYNYVSNVCFSVIVPLYRKILNDLSSDVPAVPRIEEEKSEDDSAPAITTVTMPTPIYQTSSGQYSKYLKLLWCRKLHSVAACKISCHQAVTV